MKTILITGISRGIGKATAQRFLKNGDFVIGTSTKGVANWKHKNLKIFEFNLSHSNSIKNCDKKIERLNKKIDVLINNAGIVVEDEINKPTIDTEYLRETLEVNLIGTINFTEGIIPLMNSKGHIINISSSAGSLNGSYRLNYPAYRISKTALNMVTRILAVRLNGKIIVSSVHPGRVKTDMGSLDADMKPEEAAQDIFKLANSKIQTGQFWFKGKKFPW